MTTPDAEDEDLVTEYRDAVRVHDRTPDKYNLNQMGKARAALLAQLARQRAKIARLTEERDEIEGALFHTIADMTRLRTQLEASSRKAEGLEEALRKYGQHDEHCEITREIFEARCTCGLDAALSPQGISPPGNPAIASTGDARRET